MSVGTLSGDPSVRSIDRRATGGAIPLALLDVAQASHVRDFEMSDDYGFSTLRTSAVRRATVDGGDGRRTLGGRVGSVASILPRTRLTYDIDGELDAIVVYASRAGVEAALAASGIAGREPLRHLHTADLYDPTMARTIRAIWDEAGRGDGGARLAADGLFAQLLIRALQLGRADPIGAPPPLTVWDVSRVTTLVCDLPERVPTLGALAAEIGYPPLHFARAFEAATGELPHRFVLRMQLARVREMLDGTATIAEIAEACGFASRAQLVEVFRHDMGITPTAYRIGLLT